MVKMYYAWDVVWFHSTLHRTGDGYVPEVLEASAPALDSRRPSDGMHAPSDLFPGRPGVFPGSRQEKDTSLRMTAATCLGGEGHSAPEAPSTNLFPHHRL